jgi:hypothetical protein
MYMFGFIPELAAAIGVRADAEAQVGAVREMRRQFGDNIHGLNFNCFASIEFVDRKPGTNFFGTAFYIYQDGKPKQIRQEDKDWEALYAFLHIACANTMEVYFKEGYQYWPRLMVWRLSERPDVAQMLDAAHILRLSTKAA